MAKQVSVREDVEKVGLRCDVGEIPSDEAEIGLTALDQSCADMNKVELVAGHLPKKDSEIVVSKGLLEALGIEGEIGNRITIPYQVLREDG